MCEAAIKEALRLAGGASVRVFGEVSVRDRLRTLQVRVWGCRSIGRVSVVLQRVLS